MFRLRSFFLRVVVIIQAIVTILLLKRILKHYISTSKIELIIHTICVISPNGLIGLANAFILENGSSILLKHPITEMIPKG